MFTLKLLGPPALEAAGAAVPGRAGQGRRLALLAILALARGRPVSRDRVIGLLWEESPTDRARHQLSDALYILRSGLGEDVVRSSGDGLLLNLDRIESDTAAFERLVEEGRHEEAVALVAGPLLNGFHLSQAGAFEHWLDEERARLSGIHAAALEHLARASESRDDPVQAVAWWRKLAVQDPHSGRVALRLMAGLEAAGDRGGALRHARIHATLLREDFDAEPDPEVAAFAERLRTEPPGRTASALAASESPPSASLAAPPPARMEPLEPPDLRQESPALPQPSRTAARRHAMAAAVTLLVAFGLLGLARGAGEPLPSVDSVGVLPFVDLSADPENAYLGDGLSEQIITVLSQVEGLQVAARTSSFALRDRGLNVRAIADTLRVRAVLEGSIRKDGDRVRVTAQLIDAATGYHLWSQEYDRELGDVFALQDEIGQDIARALRLRMASRTAARGARAEPGFEAYDYYLRGLYLRNSLSGEGLRQAAEYFDRAIALEPDFALAYAGKASVIAPMIYFGHRPSSEAVPELRALVDRALELDPSLGEAWAALGVLRLFFEWDWAGAESALKRAIELNPSDAHAHHHLGNYLSAMDRTAEAVAARERAVELDPLNPRSLIVLANDYLRQGRYEAATTEYRRAFDLDPVNPLFLGMGPSLPVGLGQVYLRQDRHDEAVDEFLKVATLRGASGGELTALRSGYDASGMPGFWQSWWAMDLRQAKGRPDPLRAASTWALAGDSAQALEWLERAYEERNPGLIYLRAEFALRGLRSSPRMARILREMGLS